MPCDTAVISGTQNFKRHFFYFLSHSSTKALRLEFFHTCISAPTYTQSKQGQTGVYSYHIVHSLVQTPNYGTCKERKFPNGMPVKKFLYKINKKTIQRKFIPTVGTMAA